ncbi:membrane progestin receptor gamma [Dermochelys coriacea]|uniref:membrane progestin receptor gamma n=1 Tax=Dermochelys coriacea TaxID=27794 RepID=UPI0018E84B18|nr:membrane progestin receptor gamma [Dermochelys coriacea]
MLSWKLPRQLGINQVPKVFREQGILFGYRHPRSSAADCLLSVFQMTNETLNIWTHFLPAWYFLWKLFALAYSLDIWNDMYAWPFLAYMLTCCIYPFTSSCAHTFSTMSTQARHICYFFDYGALSMYSLGKSLQTLSCVFQLIHALHLNCTFHSRISNHLMNINETLHQLSIKCISTIFFVVLTNSSIYFSTQTYPFLLIYHMIVTNRLGAPYLHYNRDIIERFPEIQQPRLSKSLRTLAFAYPYLFDSTPLFYRLYLCTGESCMESVIPVHYRHCVFAFLTCFIFAAHLPERLAPGCFDYIGHSHQLFHICGIIGTHFQMEAIFIDMNARRDWLLASSPLLSHSQTVGSVGISIIISLTIIGAFSLALYSTPMSSRKEKLHRH